MRTRAEQTGGYPGGGGFYRRRVAASVRGAGARIWTKSCGKFYGGLLKSESRHYPGLCRRWPIQYGDADDVARVIERVRETERELIESADVEFRFYSGVPQV